MKRVIMIAVFLGALLALSASEADAQYLYGYHGGLYRGYYGSYGPSLGYYGAFTPSVYTPAVGFSYPVYRSSYYAPTGYPYYSRAYYYRPPMVAYPGYPGYAYPPYGTYGGFRTPGFSFYYGR